MRNQILLSISQDFSKQNDQPSRKGMANFGSSSQPQLRLSRSSPMQSVSSTDQQSSLQQVVGKNKEYFDNLQSCYDPENIQIASTPAMARKR